MHTHTPTPIISEDNKQGCLLSISDMLHEQYFCTIEIAYVLF